MIQNQKNAVFPAAVVVTHEVANYDAWKRVFDAHSSARKQASIVASHINRNADKPNLLSVYLAATDAASLRAFLTGDDIKRAMKDAGIVGAPQLALITPVEDLTIKDRPLAGAIVQHEVSDFSAWKKAFDAHASSRSAAGIVGHAVNRGTENPNLVTVYLQAESVAALRAFAESPDLKETMKRAGVTGAPRIGFVQGQAWGN